MNTNRIFKYLVCALIIHTLIAYLPRTKIDFNDSLIIVLLGVMTLYIIDYINDNKYESFNNLIENLDVERSLKENRINKVLPKDISEIKLKEIKDNCKDDENKCNLIIDSLNISEKNKMELKLNFGYNKLNTITNLYFQNRLTREQAMDLVFAIETKSDVVVDALLNKYLDSNIITENDKNKIKELADLNDDYNKARQILANMISKDLIKSYDAMTIDKKCLSNSLNDCSTHLKDALDKKIINGTDAVSILQAYNRPSANSDFNLNENKDKFGLVSDESAANKKEFRDFNFTTNLLDNSLKKMENSLADNNLDSDFVNEEDDDNLMIDGGDNYVEIQKPGTNEFNYPSEFYNNNSDMNFTQIKPLVPLGKFSKKFTNKFDHGFTHLETHKWRPPEYDTGTCHIDKCDTCSEKLYTEGPIELSRFNESRRVLQPDIISSEYIDEKLNTGRA